MKRKIALFSLIFLSSIFAQANPDESNLEGDLMIWKIKMHNQHFKNKTEKNSPAIENISPSFVPIEKFNQLDLFSNKVSDPKIKALLEAAYKKPGALIFHTSIE